MRVLFCKIAYMKYYKGVCNQDRPQNGGKYVEENGEGGEVYNFAPIEMEGEQVCLGYVETKRNSKNGRVNDLHIEKIAGCELLANAEFAEDVLVIWCATNLKPETVIVGWYRNATVYRRHQIYEYKPDGSYCHLRSQGAENLRYDTSGEYCCSNIIAKKEDCILLPDKVRSNHRWEVPLAKKRGFGFGQSMLWYPTEERAQKYLEGLAEKIEEYDGENDIDTYPVRD